MGEGAETRGGLPTSASPDQLGSRASEVGLVLRHQLAHRCDDLRGGQFLVVGTSLAPPAQRVKSTELSAAS